MRGAFVTALLLLLVAGACGEDDDGRAPPGDKLPTAPLLDLESMAHFPAGEFTMGQEFTFPGPYGDPWFIDQVPAHQVTLSEFWLDIHEVTVPEFALFLTFAGGEYHFHPDQPIERVEGGYLPIAGTESQPMRHVTWEAADQFCRWAGKRLPTEAEWERAAAGPEGREYPWGDDGPSCRRAVYFTGQSYCEEGPREVGSRPDGVTPDSGVFDLAGNVAEWVGDRYGLYSGEDEVDPAGFEFGTRRVIRGGGYLETASSLRTRARRGADPRSRSSNVGFRCAYGGAADDDGALRGELQPPADVGRVPTDRPLAPAAARPEVLASGLTTPTEVIRLGDAWYVLDISEDAVFTFDGESDEVELLADGFTEALDMVTDGTHLYVADREAGEVARVAVDGEVTIVAEAQDGVHLLEGGEGEVFWACEEDLVRCAADGDPEVLAAIAAITDLALSPDHLYFAADSGGDHSREVGRIPLAGGDPEILAEDDDFYSPYYPSGLVCDLDDGTLYYQLIKPSWPSNVELCRMPLDGGASDCFAHSPPKGARPEILDGVLYWNASYTVVRFDPADETYTHLGDWTRSQGLAVDDEGVVFTDRDDGRVYRILWD